MSYPWLVDIPRDYVGGAYKDLFDFVARDGAVCLGLLRPAMTTGSPRPFVYTSPPVDLKLVGGDRAYILGPPTCSLITPDTH